MKTTRLNKATVCLALTALLAVCAAFCLHTPTSAQADTFASTDTDITELYTESGFFWFTLSANDYEATASKSLVSAAARLDTLNTLSKIEVDGQAIGGSFASLDPYINLFGKKSGSFTILLRPTQTLTVRAGCQFPSLNFADGTSDAIYTTTKDVAYVKQGDGWVLQMEYTDVDITDTLTFESGIASSGYTEIKLQVGENVFDNGTWFNNNATVLGDDVLANIVIRKGNTEKTARALCTENAGKPAEEQYKGGEFPQTLGGVYAPIAVRDNNNQLLVRVLTSYAEPGTFEVVLKSGWIMTLKNKSGYRFVLSRDIVLVQSANAQYKRASLVTWDVNGDVTSKWVANGDTPAYGSTPSKPSTATTDYTFTGWDKAIAAVTKDVTYTAQFGESARKYTVSFVGEDGATPISSAQVANGAHITKPDDPVKENTNEYVYTFDGWYNGATKWNFDNDNMPTNDITLTAKFTQSERRYNVSFADDAGNAYTDGAYATQSLSYNGTAVKPADPVKASTAAQVFTFEGWYNGTTKWDFATQVTADVTLTAKFTAVTRQYDVTVTFSGLEQEKASVSLKADYDSVIDLNDYNETGYGFTATANGSPINGKSYTVTGDVTIAVTYERGKYSVNFTDDAGNPYTDSAYATQTVLHNGTAVKPADPAKASTAAQVFTFEGWYNGTTKWDFATQVTADVTLTAKFTAVTRQYDVTVTFSGLEQEKASVSLKADYDSVIDLNDYNETGYGFTATANGSAISGKSYTVTGDVTIAVTYERGKYVVTFTVEGITVRPSTLPEQAEIAQGQKLTFGDYSVIDYTYKIYLGETEITAAELDIDGDVTLRVVYTPVPEDNNGNTGNGNGGKGCGGTLAGGTLAGGGVCLAALCALSLLRKRKSEQTK